MRQFLIASLLVGAMSSLTGAPAQAALGEQYPSFVEKGAVFCTDVLDFTAWQTTGKFHTRGGRDSCVVIDKLTRVALLDRRDAALAQIRVISGPLGFSVGWTNAPLPVVTTP